MSEGGWGEGELNISPFELTFFNILRSILNVRPGSESLSLSLSVDVSAS